ncbi:MAG: HDOD domain-containing protein [Myxococcota bacterium]
MQGAVEEAFETAGVGPVSNLSIDERAVEAAQALLSRPEIEPAWIKPLVRAIKRKRLKLPTLSPTTAQIVRLIENTDVEIDELSRAVMRDPGLATRVMGVANSSYFRGVSEVPNVKEALMRMGLREARTIVIVVALKSTVLSGPSNGPAALKLWKHALLTASAAQEVCAKLSPWEHVGMLAGLVHDLGKLVIMAFAQDEPGWQGPASPPPAEVIDSIMRDVHAPLGAMMLASWGFAPCFCEAVLAHEAPNMLRYRPDAGRLAASLHLSNAIAHQVEAGWPTTLEEIPEALVEEAESLGFSVERLVEIAEDTSASFEYLSRVG